MQGWDSFKNPIVTYTQYTDTTGGNTVVITVNDAIKTEITTLNATIDNIVYCTQPVNSWVNNTPTICDTTTFPNVITLNNGIGSVTLNTINGSVITSFSCSTSATYGSDYLSAYVTGSMTKYINDLIVGSVGSYTTPDPAFINLYSSGYTLNPNLYTKNIIDLSPFTDNGYAFGACLISPRHVIGVAHASMAVGQTITFADKNGSTQAKTITSISYGLGIGVDFTVGYLDSEVTGITPYSVLPANATTTTKIPLASQSTGAYGVLPQGIYGFTAKRRYPFGGGDNIRQMQISILTEISGGLKNPAVYGTLSVGNFSSNPISISTDARYPYAKWWTTVADGDSSSPTFLPTGLTTATGTPLTIYLGSQSSPGCASSVSSYIAQINSVMNTLAGTTTTYALDVISTSQSSWWNSFNSY
jgi:hypothetical protein